MKIKFTTNHSQFFKEWRCGNVRILKDVFGKTFYPYTVQTFDGTVWEKVRAFRTLAEAKHAAAWIAEDMAMEAAMEG